MDNRGFGEDDFEALANEWDIEELLQAGFDEAVLNGIPMDDVSGDSTGAADRSVANSGKVLICFGEFVGRVEKTLADNATAIVRGFGETPDAACIALCERLIHESKS